MNAWSWIKANCRTSLAGPICLLAGVEAQVGLGPTWLPKVAGAAFVLGVTWGWVQAADAAKVAQIAASIETNKKT